MDQYQSIHFKGFQLKILKKADIQEDFLEKCCRTDPENDPDFTVVASSECSRVYHFKFKKNKYFYKLFCHRNFLEPIKGLFRGTRPERALRGDLILKRCGFKTPGCYIIGRKNRIHFSVAEAIVPAKDLIQFAAEKFYSNLNYDSILLKRKLAKTLGKVVGKLHAEGVYHGDLRWGNLLIEMESPDSFAIWFLDNERTARFKKIPEKKRIINLVQMNMILAPAITVTDRMRFLDSYFHENPELVSEKKRIAAIVNHKTLERLRKRNTKRN